MIYVHVMYYCDHKTSGRPCNNHAAGPDDTIAGKNAETAGWVIFGNEHYCPVHGAEHAPPKPVRRRAPAPALAAAPEPVQPTLDDLLEATA